MGARAQPAAIVAAYSPVTRAVAVGLQLVLSLNLLDLGARVLLDLLGGDAVEWAPEPLLVRRVLLFTVAPWLALAALRLLARTRLEPGPGEIVLRGWRTSTTIPRASIVAVEPWRVPLPGPGLRIRLASGRVLRQELVGIDPSVLGARQTETAWSREAAVLRGTRLLRHVGVKLGLIPLVPVLLLFRVHAIIQGGSLAGAYQMFGLGRVLEWLVVVWAIVLCRLLVYAAVVRATVEVFALPFRWMGPGALGTARAVLEIAAMLAYLAGIALGLWHLFG
jgi:hypothetical protein